MLIPHVRALLILCLYLIMVIKFFISAILFAITFSAQAQYSDLIGATETQIKQKIPGFETAQKRKDDNQIVDIMIFESEKEKVSYSFWFFPGVDKCYQMSINGPVALMDKYLKKYTRRFELQDKNFWRNKSKTTAVMAFYTGENMKILSFYTDSANNH